LNLSSMIPIPLGGIMRVKGLPPHLQKKMNSSEAYAILYLAGRDYFTYLNDPEISLEMLSSGFSCCAEDLARLLRLGLVHTSLIPLFHRAERGSKEVAYCWHRNVAGRIDDWLLSCRYPNLRLSGLADFEHIKHYSRVQSRDLLTAMGEHLLAQSLVLGSCLILRSDLGPGILRSILRDVFEKYCKTLAGLELSDLSEVLDWCLIASRMAEEMMGIGNETNERDVYRTGRHLGAPNGPFPIPELMRAIHLASVVTIMNAEKR